MQTKYFIYAGVFLLAYFLFRLIMANKNIDKKITSELQDVINSDKYKVKGRFE